LIDDQTGRRTTILRAGCYPLGESDLEPLDLPWITFGCSAVNEPSPWQLYSTATGQWLAVSPSPGVKCGGDCRTGFLAAGRYWLQFQQVTCTSQNYHVPCDTVNVFQNIQTGEVRQDPSNASTLVDLDAANLTRTVCPPLSAGVDSLSFYGSFALATVINNQFDEWVYLERCGTRLHRLVIHAPPPGALVAADTHEVVWMAASGPARVLAGLTLPSLQRFTIRFPRRLLGSSCKGPQGSGVCGIGSFGLTNHRLYIVTVSEHPQVWAAPIPLPPRGQHK
jgi:hypothetical protein